MIATANGGRAAVGTELCRHTTTREERAYIIEREARLKAERKLRAKRPKPEHEKPGPVTWIQF